QPPPIALLHGPDEQLLDDGLALVERGLFADASERAPGREVLEGDAASIETVVRSALTLPFMTSRRLVVVRRAQALAARGAETLTAYARDPNPTTCVLLLADEGLTASRERRSDHWLGGALPARAPRAARAARPRGRGGAGEAGLRQRAAAEGLTVSDEAARLLVQWVGDDGARLLGEGRKAGVVGWGGRPQGPPPAGRGAKGGVAGRAGAPRRRRRGGHGRRRRAPDRRGVRAH